MNKPILKIELSNLVSSFTESIEQMDRLFNYLDSEDLDESETNLINSLTEIVGKVYKLRGEVRELRKGIK